MKNRITRTLSLTLASVMLLGTMAPQGDEVCVFNMVRLVRDWDADEET